MDEAPAPGFQLKTVTWMAVGVQILVILLFTAGFSSTSDFAGRVGASVAFALGASILGGLLGFLFGIPRTHQAEFSQRTSEQGQQYVEYQINTNLEQISDWLTKIIVGVGLIQLGSIGRWLYQFSITVGNGFSKGNAVAQTFVLGLSIYALTSGFLLGYLWTRLYFGTAVRQADQGLVGRIEKWEREARNDAKALSLVARQLNLTAGESPVLEDELKSAVVKASSNTRTRIFYEAVAARRNDERRELSIPVFLALIASDTASIYHQNYAQLAYAMKDKATPDWTEAEGLLTRAIEIRDRREEGGFGEYEFNRAVCRIQLQRPVSDIEQDLKKAATDDWVRSWSLGRYENWLKANELTAASLGFH